MRCLTWPLAAVGGGHSCCGSAPYRNEQRTPRNAWSDSRRQAWPDCGMPPKGCHYGPPVAGSRVGVGRSPGRSPGPGSSRRGARSRHARSRNRPARNDGPESEVLATDDDAEITNIGEIGQAHAARLLDLAKHDVLVCVMQGFPFRHTPLQRAPEPHGSADRGVRYSGGRMQNRGSPASILGAGSTQRVA